MVVCIQNIYPLHYDALQRAIVTFILIDCIFYFLFFVTINFYKFDKLNTILSLDNKEKINKTEQLNTNK